MLLLLFNVSWKLKFKKRKEKKKTIHLHFSMFSKQIKHQNNNIIHIRPRIYQEILIREIPNSSYLWIYEFDWVDFWYHQLSMVLWLPIILKYCFKNWFPICWTFFYKVHFFKKKGLRGISCKFSGLLVLRSPFLRTMDFSSKSW